MDPGLADTNLISPEVVSRAIPEASGTYRPFLRKPDGSPRLRPNQMVLDGLFRAYISYLNRCFRYHLTVGCSWWGPSGLDYQSPEGNCQNVANNFVQLLWAYGFDVKDLGVVMVECEGLGAAEGDEEKLVNKVKAEVKASDVDFDNQKFMRRRGTRCFRVNAVTGALTPLYPARNPFRFHAFCYVHCGSPFRYYDARTGLKYRNGPADYFEAYRRGAICRVLPMAPAGRLVRSREQAVQVYYDPARPRRQIYLLPDSYDTHFVVQASAGEYDVGGNWVFVDDGDWGPARRPLNPRDRAALPEHVLEFLSDALAA
jgi:hypothetical protein